jgi:hypothetical protein
MIDETRALWQVCHRLLDIAKVHQNVISTLLRQMGELSGVVQSELGLEADAQTAEITAQAKRDIFELERILSLNNETK